MTPQTEIDGDVFDTISVALYATWERHQSDPVLKADGMRLNHHLYTFAVLDALDDAGYEIVPKPKPEVSECP